MIGLLASGIVNASSSTTDIHIKGQAYEACNYSSSQIVNKETKEKVVDEAATTKDKEVEVVAEKKPEIVIGKIEDIPEANTPTDNSKKPVVKKVAKMKVAKKRPANYVFKKSAPKWAKYVEKKEKQNNPSDGLIVMLFEDSAEEKIKEEEKVNIVPVKKQLFSEYIENKSSLTIQCSDGVVYGINRKEDGVYIVKGNDTETTKELSLKEKIVSENNERIVMKDDGYKSEFIVGAKKTGNSNVVVETEY